MTTSDDKSVRVWEWDIPVDFKYIADPGMHSMPAVTKSPDEKYLAATSLDNKVMTIIYDFLVQSDISNSCLNTNLDLRIRLHEWKVPTKKEKRIQRSRDCWICLSAMFQSGSVLFVFWRWRRKNVYLGLEEWATLFKI